MDDFLPRAKDVPSDDNADKVLETEIDFPKPLLIEETGKSQCFQI
jgi:hypothetical protein